MKNLRNLLLAATAVALLALAGCSSGGTSTPAITPDGPLHPGYYSLVFSTAGADGVTVPVGGVTGTLLLPPGVAVATSEDGAIRDSALHLTLPGGNAGMVSGHLLKNPDRVELSLVAAPTAPWKGSYLRLGFLVTSQRPVVTENSFRTLNPTLGGYRVVGLDPATHSSVDMTGMVATTLSVTR